MGTPLTFPHEFEDGTVAHGDEVQAQFQAIKDFLDDLGVDSDGVPFAKITGLSNAITGAMIQSNSVGADEIIAPAILSGSPVANPTLNFGTFQNLACNVDLNEIGLYLVSGSFQFTDNVSSSAEVIFASTLTFEGGAFGEPYVQSVYVAGTPGIICTTKHFEIITISDPGTLSCSAAITNGSGNNVAANSAIQAIRLA